MAAPVVLLLAVAGFGAGWAFAPVVGQYPEDRPMGRAATVAVAVVDALAWAWVAWTYSHWWEVLAFLVLASALVCLSAIDIRSYRIPDRILFPAVGVALLLLFAGSMVFAGHGGGWDSYRNALVGAIAYFAFLFVPHLVYPRGMGFGDVKLALLMGLYLGWGRASILDVVSLCITALFIGSVLGVLSGLVVNVTRRHGGAFPFGPALAVSCLYVVLNADRFLVTASTFA